MTKLAPRHVRDDDSALVRVLEASIEALKAENEILRRRFATAEARAARETQIAGLSAIARLRARATALGEDGLGFAFRAGPKALYAHNLWK